MPITRIARRLNLPQQVVEQFQLVARWVAADKLRSANLSRHFEFSIEYGPDGRLVSATRYCMVHLPADITTECLKFGETVSAYHDMIAFHNHNATFGIGAVGGVHRPRQKLYVINDGPTISHDPDVYRFLNRLTDIPTAVLEAEASRFGHRMKGYGVDESGGRLGLKLYHGLISLTEVRSWYSGILGSAPLDEFSRHIASDLPVLICSRWVGGEWSRRVELRLDTCEITTVAALAASVGQVQPNELIGFADLLNEGAEAKVLYLSVDRDRYRQTNVYFRPGV